MKIILKRIVFPFFSKERHSFLIEKWWFRLIIVLYVIGVIVVLSLTLENLQYSAWGWCYAINVSPLDECGNLISEYRIQVILGTLLLTAFYHYVVQFIFFKIIVNYIVLGNKK